MNYKFLAALIVYAVTLFAIEHLLGGSFVVLYSVFALFVAQVAALVVSFVFYYLIRRRDERPRLSADSANWAIFLKLFLALLAIGAIAYATSWAMITPHLCSQPTTPLMGLECDLSDLLNGFLPLRLAWSYILFLASHILMPVVFWKIIRNKSHPKTIASAKTKEPRNPAQSTFVPTWIFLNILGLVALVYAIVVNATDNSGGWSILFTFPIYVTCACLMVFDAGVFIRWTIKAPKGERKRKAMYLLGAVLSVSPILAFLSYSFASHQLEQAARERANTPIALGEARQLIESCRVETIHRHDGGRLTLNETTPILPGGDAVAERRTFDQKYYEELIATARSKEVEERCGFVPSYDSERSKQPEVKKWITKAEAEAILNQCLWSTRFYEDARYFTDLELPGANTTGILLSQRLGPWNDDTESTIILIDNSRATEVSLRANTKSCY